MSKEYLENECAEVSYYALSSFFLNIIAIILFVLPFFISNKVQAVVWNVAMVVFILSVCIGLIALIERCFVKRRYWKRSFWAIGITAVLICFMALLSFIMRGIQFNIPP